MLPAICEECPKDRECPSDGPGPIKQDEALALVVLLKDHVEIDQDGSARLLITAIRNEDLDAKGPNKSISTYRAAHTDKAEILRRAAALTQEPTWKNDPVVATAVASDLRAIKDEKNVREICVFADPLNAQQDPLGDCPGHASITKSNRPSTANRMQKIMRRRLVADRFKIIKHWNSGNAPAP